VEPIKILSYEMNSAYTSIATRNTHTHKSGSKLGKHKPTGPRDKPRIKKRQHKTRDNLPDQDGPSARGLKPSVGVRRTVCE
jgi:hypothetical protein